LSPQLEIFLKEFGDVFPSEGPIGLPPLKAIEHQIDFVLGVGMPYGTNPKENKR